MRGIDKMFGGVFALAVLVFAVLGCSQFDNVPSQSAIPGTYDAEVTGGEGKGGRFDMTVDRSSTTYSIKWTTDDGAFYGRGVFMGNYIGVAFDKEGGDAVCGTIFYRSFGPQNVSGSSAVLGKENAGSETLTRKSGEGFEGEFSVYGRSVESGDYSGTLTLKKNGEQYDATWLIGGKQADGIGYVWGNLLAVVFGDAGCRFAVFRNDRGFFESSDVVRFTRKFGDVDGFSSDLLINKRSAVRSGGGE